MDTSTTRIQASADELEAPSSTEERFGPLIGRSIQMRLVFAQLQRAAATDASVLLFGESGTGKDLAAEAIHQHSARRDGPLVVVDCASLPHSLIESELFGHEKGAFTGATERRVGAFEAGHCGTVFMDEIGELPLELQPKLLRVLEKRTVKPVGSTAVRAVDVRFLAATHRDLRSAVNRGAFREDLFYRLSVVPIRMPPLRERMEDVPLLAELFARNIGAVLPEEALQQFADAEWPGNVRELAHAVERYLALGSTPPELQGKPRSAAPAVDPSIPFKESKRAVIDHFEKAYLAALMKAAGGNVSGAARTARIDRVYLFRLLRRHGLK